MPMKLVLTMSTEQLDKVLAKKAQVAMVYFFQLQVNCLGEKRKKNDQREEISVALQEVLERFKEVFEELGGYHLSEEEIILFF